MRAAEWINTLAFTFLTILAWLRALEARRRITITVLGGAGLGLTAASATLAPRLLPTLTASVTRDWLPYLLLLMFYWQAGQFFTRVDRRAQSLLEGLDERIVLGPLAWCAERRSGRVLLTLLELAYLLCYLSLPAGLAALYIMRRGSQADRFWSVVLAATYVCYALVPFIQTKPPRMSAEPGVTLTHSPVRAFNLWILRRASIHANTFPSAHVACSMACALVLLRVSEPVGLVFLLIAICIALGAVAGRYHYAADVIFGVAVALAAFVARN